MSKHALLSLPLLVAAFVAFLGCPASSSKPPSSDPPGDERRPAVGQSARVSTKPAANSETAASEQLAALSTEREAPQDQARAAAASGSAGAKLGGNTDRGGYGDKPPLTAEQKKELLFTDWSKPKLALVLTGEQLGYIEPCGCAGLDNQKGGLRRRHTFLKQLHAEEWPTMAFDLGGLITRFGRQSEIKYETTANGMKRMGYAAIGFGSDDLKLPAGMLLSVATDFDEPEEGQDRAPSPFVSANVGLFGFEFLSRYRVIEAGGMKLGVTSILGDGFHVDVNSGDIEFLPAAQALTEVLPELKQAGCDYLLLLSYARPEESIELAKAFPDFDIVVTAAGADEPPYEARTIEGSSTLLVEVGHKGMYAVVLGLYDDPQEPLRYQRVPLDARFKDSPEIDELLAGYQEQLHQEGWQGLGLAATQHPRSQGPGDLLGTFVGSQQCGECHLEEFEIWHNTPHAHATETLTSLTPARQFDPECISCHSTGWNPQEYFRYISGFDSLESTPLLAGNGCENCHGPGAAHAAAEMDGHDELREQLRQGMRLTLSEAKEHLCARCHDLDNSPAFSPQSFDDHYWPAIEH